MFSIGEFSKITGLTVKTLRFYQAKNLLMPSAVDPDSNYRYYDVEQIPVARIIGKLRDLEFSLNEIHSILSADDDSAVLTIIQKHKESIDQRTRNFRRISGSLDELIQNGLKARTMIQNSENEVVEKQVDEILVAGIRMQGHYRDCGKGFGKLGRKMGRQICGKPLLLIYDDEYRENDADFEACFPVRKGVDGDGISVRQLAGGRCLSVIHRGPYDEVGEAYETLLKHAKRQDLQLEAPCREIYIKGPGMIFRGNPKNYVTEVQMMIANQDQ